ncbi:MAG: thioredoxin family protein [Thiotrichales bacterium]|nr:MAG: thioredoxin family protein [Thiotrichales bacterium]
MLLPSVSAVSAYAASGIVYEYEEEEPESSLIPRLSSLQQVASIAREKGVPILVEFTTPWCQYCEALEEHVLKPLILNGKYRDQIIVKKLEVNAYSSIAGFDGKRYSSDQISRMYRVSLYPTLVFFNANGEEISQRIVGITVLEYVAGELEKAIDVAVQDTAAI